MISTLYDDEPRDPFDADGWRAYVQALEAEATNLPSDSLSSQLDYARRCLSDAETFSLRIKKAA